MCSSIIGFIVLMVCIFVYFSGYSISWGDKFSISFPYWWGGLGIVIIISSIVFMIIMERDNGRRDGLKRGSEITLETLEDKLNENNR